MLKVKGFFGESKLASAGSNTLRTGRLPAGVLVHAEIGNQTNTCDVSSVTLTKLPDPKGARIIPQVLGMPALEYVTWDGEIKLEVGFAVTGTLAGCTASDFIELTVLVER